MSLAKTYIWWKSPDEALEFPERIITQVMNMGDWTDVRIMEKTIPRETLRDALQNAQAGWLDPPSWHFWHYRLGLAKTERDVPPLPQRRIP